jgi:hypothetical protein
VPVKAICFTSKRLFLRRYSTRGVLASGLLRHISYLFRTGPKVKKEGKRGVGAGKKMFGKRRLKRWVAWEPVVK